MDNSYEKRKLIQNSYTSKSRAIDSITIAPRPTPAPIPALAPVESPGVTSDESDVSDPEVIEVNASLVTVGDVDFVVVVDDPAVSVAAAAVNVDSSLNIVPTTVYSVALRSHVAQIPGLDGSTWNLPTPLLQQSGLWSQQYDVSLFVTFEHDTRSVPPVSAPA
ncbi:hypothetical protein NW762_007558 [Fusarium torreyae]|uniref:Uncharacterized protein n=1 Tax=Fusarium torreyae TaxID=1237075 RepID=A0A9W8RYR4_9HYPO|nr:hypothetical protein NW762_007558 [Fusarium torreyae]